MAAVESLRKALHEFWTRGQKTLINAPDSRLCLTGADSVRARGLRLRIVFLNEALHTYVPLQTLSKTWDKTRDKNLEV